MIEKVCHLFFFLPSFFYWEHGKEEKNKWLFFFVKQRPNLYHHFKTISKNEQHMKQNEFPHRLPNGMNAFIGQCPRSGS
jgi:hypothetical protein